MPHYRLTYWQPRKTTYDPEKAVCEGPRTHDFSAPDDDAARRHAQEFLKEHKLEIGGASYGLPIKSFERISESETISI